MHRELYERIGLAIRKQRDRVGMTQATLAELSGLSRTSVTNIERGGQAVLVHQLVELAKALGVSPTSLLAGDNRTKVSDSAHVTKEFRALLDRLEDSPSRSRSR
jgi:transcriptional regulator with XRE-family HTH domain